MLSILYKSVLPALLLSACAMTSLQVTDQEECDIPEERPAAKEKNTPEYQPQEARFIAHEWGTFTSLVDANGKTLAWYSLKHAEPLPSFVYTQWFKLSGGQFKCTKTDGCVTVGGQKEPLKGTVRMETPVVYFYTQAPKDLTLTVGFPKGYITEWYPFAGVNEENPNSIFWRFRVDPSLPERFPVEEKGREYYEARATDATPLSTHTKQGVTEVEKLLFYRGLGTFEVPLSAREITEESRTKGFIQVSNDTQGPIEGVFLFENQGGKMGFTQLKDSLEPGTKRLLARPTLKTNNLDAICSELEDFLVSQGLYGKEARAMINTWKSSWFEEGIRVLYIVPRPFTDEVLPFSLSETPDELVRVLVGRIDILTESLTQEIQKAAYTAKDNGKALIARYGRFAQPALEAALATEKDPVIAAKLQTILAQ